jgi:hypothetical protein
VLNIVPGDDELPDDSAALFLLDELQAAATNSATPSTIGAMIQLAWRWRTRESVLGLAVMT